MANLRRLTGWLAAVGMAAAGLAALGGIGAPVVGAYAQAATPGATALPQAQVLSPRPGQALQGSVPIEIGIAGAVFQEVEVSFAYAANPGGGRFLIYTGSLPQDPAALQEPITQWNTGAITDGDYTLYVDLILPDGSRQTLETTGLRVRNYTPIETDTPPPPTATAPPAPSPAATQPAGAAVTAVPTAALTAPPTAATPTPTPSPTPASAGQPARNPAELEAAQVWLALGRGAVLALGGFALGILYYLIRRIGRSSV